jgi:hypothetical protein
LRGAAEAELADAQEVRPLSPEPEAQAFRHLTLIREAHPDLLEVDASILNSPRLPTGRGIYYFVRTNGTGTDVVVASTLAAAIAMHAGVDSGPGRAYWAPGPLNAALEASPAIREAKSGRIGRPRLVRRESDWSVVPPGAGIYRIRLLGEDPAHPPVAVYIGRSGNFKLRPRRHEKVPLNPLGQQQFGVPNGVDRIELIYAVADGPDMWNSRTLDAMEELHIARATKRHELNPLANPRVVNVTVGRNGPPSNPRAHLFVWPAEEDAQRDLF